MIYTTNLFGRLILGGALRKATGRVMGKRSPTFTRLIIALVFALIIAVISFITFGPNLITAFFVLVPLLIIVNRTFGLVVSIIFLLAVALPASASLAQAVLKPAPGAAGPTNIPVLGPLIGVFQQWGGFVGIATGAKPPEEQITPATQVGGKKAVEITAITLNKRSVGANELFFFDFAIEHQGDPKLAPAALLPRYGVYFDTPAREAGAKILSPDTRLPIQGILDPTLGKEVTQGFFQQDINFNMLPGQSRRLNFPLQAPSCSGSFRVGAFIDYEYSVDADFLINVYSLDTFLREQQEGKLKLTVGRAESSSGPFLLSIDTDSQPISTTSYPFGPIRPGIQTQSTIFPIDVEVRNQRDNSAANVKNITLRIIPGGLVKIEKPDVCDFEGNDATGVYTAKRAKAGEALLKKRPPFVLQAQEAEPFKCRFVFTDEAIRQITKQQITVTSRVDYNLRVFQDTSFDVPPAAGVQTCEAERTSTLQARGTFAYSPDKGFPRPRAEVLDVLAAKICGCSTYWGQGGEQTCGPDFAVNIEGCTVPIAAADILKAVQQPKYSKLQCSNRPDRISLFNEKNEWVGNLKDAGSKFALSPDSVYTIRMRYKGAWLVGDPSIEVLTVNVVQDTIECNQPDLYACKPDEAKFMCANQVCTPIDKAGDRTTINAKIAEQTKKLRDAGVDPLYPYVANPTYVCTKEITCTQIGKVDTVCPSGTPYCGADGKCTALATCGYLTHDGATVGTNNVAVTPRLTGGDCSGKTVHIWDGRCTTSTGQEVVTCIIGSTGSCSQTTFTKPTTSGVYTYQACIDLTGDNAYNDPGETASVTFQIP